VEQSGKSTTPMDASYKSNSIGRATRVPSVIPQKIPPSRVEQSGKSTTPMEPKDYHSVEIYEKSPDINLVISYHENLEINIEMRG